MHQNLGRKVWDETFSLALSPQMHQNPRLATRELPIEVRDARHAETVIHAIREAGFDPLILPPY
jgi:hypothetical protein